MSISKIENEKEWTLISTTAITTAASFVSITGISGYRDLLVLCSGVDTAVSANIWLRINNQTSALYYFTSGQGTDTFFTVNTAANSNDKSAGVQIFDAHTTGPKRIAAAGANQSGENVFFYDGAAITQLDLLPNTGTFNSVGNIYFFGKVL